MKCKLATILKRVKQIPSKTLVLICVAATGGAVSTELLTAIINIIYVV